MYKLASILNGTEEYAIKDGSETSSRRRIMIQRQGQQGWGAAGTASHQQMERCSGVGGNMHTSNNNTSSNR